MSSLVTEPISESAVVPAEKRRASDWFAVVARWVLGAAFIYLGVMKLRDQVEFLKLIRQYELVNSSILLNSIAAALPWFEIFCGVLLVLGVAVRGAALAVAAMLLPFTLLVLRHSLGLAAAQHIPLCAVKFDCGCGTGEVWICRKLVENTALFCVAVWLVFSRKSAWCLRHSLFRS